MSGPNTPFIPPLLAPSPNGHSPVIPPDNTSRPQAAPGPTAQPMQQPFWPPQGPGFPGGMPPQGPGFPGGMPPQGPFYGPGMGTPYNQPFIPPQPYSASIGGQTPLPPMGTGGLSADYVGLPTHLQASPMGQPPPHIPPPNPGAWHGVHPNTIPLHHAPGMQQQVQPPSPWYPQGQAQRPMHFATPMMGGFGGVPLGGDPFMGGGWPSPAGGFGPGLIANAPPHAMGGGGGFYDMGGGPPPGAWPRYGGGGGAPPAPPQPQRIFRDTGDKVTKWAPGQHYGPVLTPFQLKIVEARLEINPLLLSVPEEGEHVHLKWNMLMPSSLVHRSDDHHQISWSKGRSEPATFPRITQLRITSSHFPWLIEVRAENEESGVTCGEVIDTIAKAMDKLTSASDYSSLSKEKQAMVNRAYRHNRSRSADVPGGRLGEGLKRMDFLCDLTAFGGLEADEGIVQRTCSVTLPGYVVLRCVKERTPLEQMSEQKQRAQELHDAEQALARERIEAQRAEERSRASSARGSVRSGGRESVRSGGRESVRSSTRGSASRNSRKSNTTSSSVSGSYSGSDIGIDVEDASDDESSSSPR